MFGIGLPELLIIALFVFIAFKPEDLPRVFRKAGAVLREMRNAREEFLKGLREFDAESLASNTKEEKKKHDWHD